MFRPERAVGMVVSPSMTELQAAPGPLGSQTSRSAHHNLREPKKSQKPTDQRSGQTLPLPPGHASPASVPPTLSGNRKGLYVNDRTTEGPSPDPKPTPETQEPGSRGPGMPAAPVKAPHPHEQNHTHPVFLRGLRHVENISEEETKAGRIRRAGQPRGEPNRRPNFPTFQPRLFSN